MMARECILEAYHHHQNTSKRTNTSTVLMHTVRERDEAWEAAKAMVGHDHPKGKPQKKFPPSERNPSLGVRSPSGALETGTEMQKSTASQR